MPPFSVLGLSRDADEPAIKRAYARLLRQHRPDEDPIGFQRLHEAYEYCLAIARRPAAAVSEDDADEYEDRDEAEEYPVLALAPAPAPVGPCELEQGAVAADGSGTESDAGPDRQPDQAAPDDPPFDVEAFVDALIAQSQTQADYSLERWLLAVEPLYSIALKDAITQPLLHALCEHRQSLDPQALAIVLRFFNLDTVGPARYWLQQPTEWLLRRAETAAYFQQQVAWHRSRQCTPIDRQLFQELLGPRHRLRRLLLALMPGLPGRVIELHDRLLAQGGDYAVQQLHADAVDFWHRATDLARLDRWRLAIVFARVALLALVLAGITQALTGSIPLAAEVAGTGASIALIAWLAYAIFGFLRAQLRIWQQRRPDQDLLWRVIAGSMLVGILLAVAQPYGQLAVAAILLSLCLVAFSRPLVPRWDAVLSLIASYLLFGQLVDAHVMPHFNYPSLRLALVATLGISVVMLRDWYWARSQRISLQQARCEQSFLWVYSIAAFLLAMFLS